MNEKKVIHVPDLCRLHQSGLVHGAGFRNSDPWQALIIVSQIVIFQGATCGQATWELVGGSAEGIKGLGCLACYLPKEFAAIVEVAKSKDLQAVKALGEKWIEDAKK